MSAYNESEQRVGPIGEESEQTRATPLVGPPQEGGAYGDDDGYAEDRQRERFGGINWGAGFFGWLTTAVVAIILSAVAAGAVSALGRTSQVLPGAAAGAPGTVGIVAAAILFGVLVVAYFAGGYVAGRMSRFDGGRQGVGVWIVGLLLVAAAVALALTVGRQSGLLTGINLPTLPMQSRTWDIRGIVAAAAALVCTLLAAVAGGRVGCRYHRKVDDAAYG